jgi:hypothetical protein
MAWSSGGSAPAPPRRWCVGLRARFSALTVLLLVAAGLAGCGGVLRPSGAASSHAPSPTATPVPPLRPMVSISEAWGPNAAAATLTTQVDASHYLPGFALSPDGRNLFGYEVTLVQGALTSTIPAQAGFLDIASRQFTAIGVASQAKCVGNSCQYAPPTFYLHCCQTDGRFLIATSTGYPGPDCGGCLWSYDRRTGALYEVAAGDRYQGIGTALVDHGVLVFGTGTGILIADLAARTLTPLAGTTGGTLLDAFSWPYVLYGSAPSDQQTTTTPTPLRALDLADGATTPLPQVSGTILSLVGNALYYIATPSGGGAGGATLDELDHVSTPGARPRVLATLPSGPGTRLPTRLALDGDTLFYSVVTGLPSVGGCLPGFGVTCPTPAPTPPPVTTLYQLDDHRSGSAHARAIAAYAANLGDVLAANARLVVCFGAAWDRAESRFVALETPATLASGAPDLRVDATGDYLMLAQPLSQGDLTPSQVTIYDAAHLPILTG